MIAKSKFFAGIISFLVIGMLFILGPAQALNLSISLTNNNIIKGAITSFILDAQIKDNEVSPIQNFTLKLNGPDQLICNFQPNGVIINGCSGMTIQVLNSTQFGYSYSYGYGFLAGDLLYNITLNSNILNQGTYGVSFTANFVDGNKETDHQQLIILPKQTTNQTTSLSICSLRGKKGSSFINQTLFSTDNHLSLYVPENKATKGDGYITTQNKNERVSFNFNIEKAYRIVNTTLIVFEANGVYRSDRTSERKINATITLNKANKKINLSSSIINVYGLDASILKGC